MILILSYSWESTDQNNNQFKFILEKCQAQKQRGAASGLAIALQYVFRAIAPACAGVM